MRRRKPSKSRRLSFVERVRLFSDRRESFVSYRHRDNPDSIPKKGHAYWFFDDGKCGASRRYIAEAMGVYTMKYIRKKFPSLFKAWQIEAIHCSWLYAIKSDYVIRCKVHEYDDKPCWFFRTNDGGWFSIDYPSFWMSGELDTRALKIQSLVKEIESYQDEKFKETNIDQIRNLEMKRLDISLEYEHTRGNLVDISYGEIWHRNENLNLSEFVGKEIS